MNAAEAGAVELEEPCWSEVFEQQCARWPRLPRYLQEDAAYEETLRQWRRWHWTPVEIDGETKQRPASAVEGMIALARLGILAPRSTWNEIPHSDVIEGYQHDNHCWLSIAQEQWRIIGVEDRMLCLEKGFQSERETKQINLNTAKWTHYIDAAVQMLEAIRQAYADEPPQEPPSEETH